MNNSKDPPDKYRTFKCALKNITTNDFDYRTFFDALTRTNKIIIYCYQFLRLWLLYKYRNSNELPIINKYTIKIAFSVLSVKPTGGPKIKGNNLKLFNELNKFYEDEYKNLNFSKISILNLSQILSYTAVDIVTNIENNIKMNFFSYVKRFVNSSFKKIHDELINNSDTKTKLRKELRKELFIIKEDLIKGTLNSNIKYYEFINKHKVNIFPIKFIDSYQFDIKNNCQNYLKGMIYMCIELEKIEAKSFQFFPLRTQMIPKYIPTDTKSLIE